MSRPTVRKQVELPAGGSAARVKAYLKLVAAIDGEGFGYSGASLADIGGTLTATADSTGLISFPNVRPNSGGSSDVITSPVGTVYELTTVFHDGRRVVEHINVPDATGPVWVQNLLTVPPSDLDVFDAVTTATFNNTIAGYVPLAQKGATSGVASLDASSTVPLAQLARAQRSHLIDPRNYGAVGDAMTDDTAALNAALGVALATGTPFTFGTGTYKTTGTVIVQCEVVASASATIVSSAAVAVQLGVVGTTINGANVVLPKIRRAAASPHTGVGLKAVDMDSCSVMVPDVFDFADSVVLAGDAQGIAYNTIIIGRLYGYNRNMVLEPVNGGWCNQNTIIGGRWAHNRSGSAVAGTRQIDIIDGNTNMFLGCSLEGNVPEYHIAGVNAAYNRFYACRFETTGVVIPTIYWGELSGTTYSNGNMIEGSFTAPERRLRVIQSTHANRNHTRDQFLWRGQMGDDSGAVILSNINSDGEALISILSSSTDPHAADPNVDYKLWLAAGGIRAKNTADPFARVYLDAALGRLYFGNGTADPTATARLRYNSGLELVNDDFWINTAGKGLRVINAKILSGAGSPEGVVTASIGSQFLRSDGVAGTTLYLKTSGSGTTGWTQVPVAGQQATQAHGPMGTSETFNAATATVHTGILDSNSAFTFTGAAAGVATVFTLLVAQDSVGGHTVTWPASVVWLGGTAATVTPTADTTTGFRFLTADAGVTWYGVKDSTAGGSGGGASAAVDVTNTPAGNLAAADVQGALNELDTEKAALSGAAFTGAVSVATARVGGSLGGYASDAGNTGTTETNLYSANIPASTLGAAGASLEARFGGTFANSTSTKQLRVYLDTTLIYDSGARTTTSATTWNLRLLVARVSSTTVRCVSTLTATGSTPETVTQYSETTGLTPNLGNAKTFKLTGTAADVGAATNDIVARVGSVAYVPA